MAHRGEGRIAVGPRKDLVIKSLRSGPPARVFGDVPISFLDNFHMSELLEVKEHLERGDWEHPILNLWKSRAQKGRRMRAC